MKIFGISDNLLFIPVEGRTALLGSFNQELTCKEMNKFNKLKFASSDLELEQCIIIPMSGVDTFCNCERSEQVGQAKRVSLVFVLPQSALWVGPEKAL